MTEDWLSKQAQLCDRVSRLNSRYARSAIASTINADAIISALEEFQECVRYLNTRRSSGAILNLNSEADVQDAVYLMLRPWVHDLTSENSTDRISNRYAIKDFISCESETVIEIKFVRDVQHGRHISSEMHDDIELYRHHPKCRTLIFFVYDPDSLIPDQGALRMQIEVPRLYGGRSLRCILIVKP